MRICILLPLVTGKDIRHGRSAGAEIAGEVFESIGTSVMEPITQVVDTLSNFGSMVNDCVQTAYIVKEYEINKKQLAIAEQDLISNRIQAKIAVETLDWEKEKFRIEQKLQAEDFKETAQLQRELNTNMVNVMGHMANTLEKLVEVTKNTDLKPMYRDIMSFTFWFLEKPAETEADIEKRNNRLKMERRRLRDMINNDDFDLNTFYHVMDHVTTELMTRNCDYEAISNLTIQINTMFNLLMPIVQINLNSNDADILEERQKYFLEKSIMFHLKKNWLMHEPEIKDSQLCFEPYYRNTTTTSICYDYDENWKLPSETEDDLEKDCFTDCDGKTGKCLACGYAGYCCSKTNFDPENQQNDPSRCPNSAILAASTKSGMLHDQHTCVFKEGPQQIFITDGAWGYEMKYTGRFNHRPSFQAYDDDVVFLYEGDSWQFKHQDNSATSLVSLRTDSIDPMDINGYEIEGSKITIFDDAETYESFLTSPKDLNITVNSSDAEPNHLLSGQYDYYKMMNNAQSFIKRSKTSDELDLQIFLWWTGQYWVFTEEYMFGKTNPIDWLKFKSLQKSIKYLGADWLEHSGGLSNVQIDFDPQFLDQENILIDVISTSDYWWWRGDDVRIVHQTKFGEFISSTVILEAGETKRSTYFDVRPDDRFVIKNGGSNGVYIKELTIGGKMMEVNGKSSFWIDGNKIECYGSELATISELIVVNGEVIWTPCNDL